MNLAVVEKSTPKKAFVTRQNNASTKTDSEGDFVPVDLVFVASVNIFTNFFCLLLNKP